MTTCVILLPPANEVWGKVIFLVACVKNSVHRGEYLGRYTHPGRYPLGRYIPPLARHTPLARYTPLSSVCKEFCSQGEYLGRYTPGQVHPRLARYTPVWPGTPPGQIHPQTDTLRQVHPAGAGMPNPHPHPHE